MPCPAQWDALCLVSWRCCLPSRTNNGNASGGLSCRQNAPPSRSHLGIPQMKADFNEHCVSKPASSHPARAIEGTSHLPLLTQRNAVVGRSYPTFLCRSNRALVVSCKNRSLFLGDYWLLGVGPDGISGVGGSRWCWDISQLQARTCWLHGSREEETLCQLSGWWTAHHLKFKHKTCLLTSPFNYTSWEDRNRSNFVGRKYFWFVFFFTAVWFAVDYWQNWEESESVLKTET